MELVSRAASFISSRRVFAVKLTPISLLRRLATVKDPAGQSYSPKAYDLMQAIQNAASSNIVKFSLGFLGLVGTPLAFYNCLPASSPSGILQAMINFWDGCLLLSSTMVFATCMMVSFYYAITEPTRLCPQKDVAGRSLPAKTLSFRSKTLDFMLHSPTIRFHRLAFCTMLFFV